MSAEVTGDLETIVNQEDKSKVNDSVDNCDESVHINLNNLSAFKVDKILSNNTNRKTVCLQGTFEALEGVGVIVLEKTAFEEDNLKDGDYFANSSSLKKQFHNDIYGNYEYFPQVELNG